MTKGVTMQLNTLSDALFNELADLYDAEQQLLEKLPRIARAISTSSLRVAVENHADETRDQVSRLENAFGALGKPPTRDICESMLGLLEEIDEILAAAGEPHVKDAVLIGALQRIEHYEIAAYGTARAFAEQLDLDDVADLLQESLDEEAFTDRKLTQLAEGSLFSGGINTEASQAGQPRV